MNLFLLPWIDSYFHSCTKTFVIRLSPGPIFGYNFEHRLKFSLSWNTVPHTISTIYIFAYWKGRFGLWGERCSILFSGEAGKYNSNRKKNRRRKKCDFKPLSHHKTLATNSAPIPIGIPRPNWPVERSKFFPAVFHPTKWPVERSSCSSSPAKRPVKRSKFFPAVLWSLEFGVGFFICFSI